MEEKDSEISGPCEKFWISFCGEVPSGSVAWYSIEVSEITESSTKELKPFSVTEHFPSVYCAFLEGYIYSLGGQERGRTGGQRSGRTLLNDVRFIHINYLVSLAARGKKLKRLKEPEFEKPQKSLKEPEKPQKRLKEPEFEKPKEPEINFTEPFEPFDLLNLRWNGGPPMTFARCNPHTMVVDQKLYVLGGFELNQKNQADGWIEVFDPKGKRWESLPSPPDQIHSSVMISGLLKAKKEIIIAKQRWDRDPMSFYSYNIMTRRWNTLVPHRSEASVHLPPNAGRAVTVDNTLYWISTEEHNHECIIRAYDLDRNMWFEDHLNTATIFGSLLEGREHFSSIYSSRPGFLHLRYQKFCLLLQSSITKDDLESSIEYLYCAILDISPIYEQEDRGKFKWKKLSVQKYSMDQYINFLDCMLVLEDRVSGVKSVDRGGQSTSSDISFQEDRDALSALKDGEVISIHSVSELEPKLNAASKTARLAILYFTATLCGPSHMISPLYTSLAGKYPKVVFLKVDIVEATDVAAHWNISAVPTFLFLKNGKAVDKVVGADKSALERKIAQHAG
ncbi:hypothetical protein SO802_028245 [Lithocarpus litseifolius]|uniref:Thioredoxin domain-containing protein n=1 Tax=Lithocarpus litseifolius TaxID=425828 RepID=A0AAW2BPR1_9ROSI